MPRNIKKRRRNLWMKNPHCYWCGIATRLLPQSDSTTPDAATVDHIRSKFVSTRTQNNNFPKGIRVLACWQCNNERCKIEQNGLYKSDPKLFNKNNKTTTAPESLHRAHAELSTAIIGYLHRGGIIEGNGSDCVLKLINIVEKEREYKREYKYKQPNGPGGSSSSLSHGQ